MQSSIGTCKQIASISNVANKTRKYSREELFKFAKQMRGDGPPDEELDKFETAQCHVIDEYGLLVFREKELDENETANSKRFSSTRTLYALGRQRSELSYEFNSLIEHHRNKNSNGDLSKQLSSTSKPRIVSRMTSSPSIKYNKRATSGQLDDYDGISMQARAKYERLIESCANSTGHQPPPLTQPLGRQSVGARHNPLTRTVSNNSWLASNAGYQQHHQKSIERPTQIFGHCPLRREVMIPKQGRRNSSDEPQSLPYFSANLPAHDNNWSKTTSNTMTNQCSDKLLADNFSKSPITRISADDKTNNSTNEGSATNDEDDFDITSLLSITVLSDIKTIRHDLQSSSRPSSNLSTKQLSSAGKSRSQETSMRPLNRARTATDFTYNGRHSRDTGIQKPRSNNLYFSSGYRSSGAESLSYWPQQIHHHQHQAHHQLLHHKQVPQSEHNHNHRDYQAGFSQPNSLTENYKEPRDSTQAKIIEMFKVQVMERARAKELPPAATQKTEKNNNNAAPAKRGATEMSDAATGKGNTRRDSLARTKDSSDERKKSLSLSSSTNTEREAQINNQSTLDSKRDSTSSTGKKSEEPNNAESETRAHSSKTPKLPNCDENNSVIETSQPKAPANFIAKDKDVIKAESTIAKLDPVKSEHAVSSIPRLISLHKAKLNTSSKTGDDEARTSSSSGPKSLETSTTTTCSLSSSKRSATKFVSQYKQLRGKSLADEVNEVSK